MDKDTVWRLLAAVAVSFLIVQLWSQFFMPKPVAPTPAITAPATAAPAAPVEPAVVTPAQPSPLPAGNLPQVLGESNQTAIDIETDVWKISLSARGGRVLQWKLKRFTRDPRGSSPDDLIDLVSPEARALDRHPLVLITGDEAIDKRLNETWCVVDRTPPTAEELAAHKLPAGSQRIAFHFSDGELELHKSLWLAADDSYLAIVDWAVTKAGQPLSAAAISWGPGVVRPEDHRTSGHVRGDVKLGVADKVIDIRPTSGGADQTFGGGSGVRWIGLDEQYFAVALVPMPDATSRVRMFETPQSGDGHERQASIEVTGGRAPIFAGPKTANVMARFDTLQGTDLEKMVPWGFFGVVAKPLYQVVAYFQGVLHNWGLAIILTTFLIKLAFFPLTQRSMVTMRKTQTKMAKLQPKLKKLKDKYEGKRDMDSRQKQNQEMMALYSTEGINPLATLGGCLPLLLQMPVLYAMYTALTVPTELRGAPFFGWVHDLSSPEPAPWLMLIGMVSTQFVQQLMAMTKTEDPQMKAQQRMMMFMPLMFAFFFWSMPAGLVLYWFVNNLLGILQQYLINKQAATLPQAA